MNHDSGSYCSRDEEGYGDEPRSKFTENQSLDDNGVVLVRQN